MIMKVLWNKHQVPSMLGESKLDVIFLEGSWTYILRILKMFTALKNFMGIKNPTEICLSMLLWVYL